jgi:crossover junction endodeoxyribonuclease RuvC
MYLYAFDPSLSCTALTIFEIERFEPVFIGSYPINDKQTHGMRLHHIRSGIIKDGKEFTPSDVALERGFSKFNNDTQAMFKVHGVINELLHVYDQTYYMPTTVKLMVAGYGGATKDEVQQSILANFPNIKFKNNDESDSFAVGICHLIKKYKMPWNAIFKGKKKEKKTTVKSRKKKVEKE